MRYKVTIAYDGHNYSGWQVQNNAPTIQPIVEKAISTITKTPTIIYASGRTDREVHAYGQVFHFDTELTIPNSAWVKAINALLPLDIRVKQVEQVDSNFHARYNAVSKTYVYKINTGEYDLFQRNYIYQYGRPLDLGVITAYAELITGTHNFGSFNATPFEVVPDQVKTIESFQAYYENDILIITIIGTGFLRHMVRVLVGTLIALCETKITKPAIIEALLNQNKDIIPYKVSGCGLYLQEVTY